MVDKKKSWKEKLSDSKNFPKVEKIEGKLVKKWGEGTVVIPAPKEVDELMKKVPKGRLATINQIRAKLAKKHKATISCPICCGIFSNIAAHAAAEEITEGRKNITPFWRTLKSDGSLNPKYPGGVDFQADQLKKEGFEIDRSHKIPRIKDFEKYLI